MWTTVLATDLLLFAWSGLASPPVSILSEAPAYCTAVSFPVVIRVVVEPPPASGLFSYGLKLRFEPEAHEPPDLHSILVPTLLDHTGLAGQGALKEVGPAYAAVSGTVDLAQRPINPYRAPLLATFVLHPRQIGTSRIELEFYRRAGPNEDVFVDGVGRTLDPQIVFRGADLVVSAPPALSVERLPAREEGGPPRLRLSFPTCQDLVYTVESLDGPTGFLGWQPLPGAPHNRGEVWVEAGFSHRFYRLRLDPGADVVTLGRDYAEEPRIDTNEHQ